MKKILIAFASVYCLTAVLIPPAAQAESPEKALLNAGAPRVIEHLLKEKYGSVAVLKFLIEKPGSTRDNVGTLNMDLANMLETTLVLAQTDGAKVRVLTGASGVAARLPGANHLTEEGRALLLDKGRYPCAWGDTDPEVADALVCGCAAVSKNLKTMCISLIVFGKKDRGVKLTTVATFCCDITRAHTLTAMGESFRGSWDDLFGRPQSDLNPPKPEPKLDVVEQAFKIKENPETNPVLPTSKPPILFTILINGKKVEPKIVDGYLQIPEPGVNDKVTFHVERNTKEHPDDKATYGMVVSVNGVTTLGQDVGKDPLQCRKWLLEPNDKPFVLPGFYNFETKKFDGFVVRSPKQSKENEINYGSDVGLITITLFRNRQGAVNFPPVEPVQILSAQKSRTFDETFAKLVLAAETTKGLIEKGSDEIKVNLEAIKFKPHPEPVYSASIRYYGQGSK